MRRPPLVVIVISALFIVAGIAGLVGDFMNTHSLAEGHYETVWIAAVHVLGIVAGVFMLLGHNWARWLAIAWMAFHVAITFGHPLQLLVSHAILLVLFAYGLFRAEAKLFFASRGNTA